MTSGPTQSVTVEEFVAGLALSVPEVQELLEEHSDDFEGKPLIHLVMADLLPFAQEIHLRRDVEVLGRLLAAVDAGLRDGDERLVDGIALSFVENAGPWDPDAEEFIAAWPSGLRAEAARHANG